MTFMDMPKGLGQTFDTKELQERKANLEALLPSMYQNAGQVMILESQVYAHSKSPEYFKISGHRDSYMKIAKEQGLERFVIAIRSVNIGEGIKRADLYAGIEG